MEKKIAGVLGAVAALGALGTLGTAQAATGPNPADVLTANSYADLLEPIPNAPQILQALDSQPPAKTAEANVQVAQFYHHHHHHHHGYYHHHHHHWRAPVVVVPRRRWHHHHHHHHHHGFGIYVR